MHRHSLLTALLTLSFSGGGALAEPATPEVAKSIERDYVAFFGPSVVDQGVVSVVPQGEDYLVTWDLQKALDLGEAPQGAFQVDNFTYLLTPGPGDSWKLKSERLPRLVFDVPTDKGKASGVVDFNGFRVDNVFDPQASEFLRSTLGIDKVAGAFHMVDGPRASDFTIDENAIAVETRAKSAADGAGIDIAVAQSVNGIEEAITAPQPGGQGAPIQMNLAVGSVAGGAAFTGLRAEELGEFWKYLVAHAGEPGPAPEIEAHLRATLPLWKEIRANAEIDDVKFELPFGNAAMKSLGETVDISGLTATGVAELGVKVEDLSLTSTLLPSWISSLSPISLDFDLRLTGEGWDKAAAIALNDPRFLDQGDLSPEVGDRIAEVLAAGHPKLVLTPGHLKIPALDLAYEGEVSVAAGVPSGRFNISADSLDKAIALLQDIATIAPEAEAALLSLTMLKGMATTGSDGRLVWAIEASGDGPVTVNGSPLPFDK